MDSKAKQKTPRVGVKQKDGTLHVVEEGGGVHPDTVQWVIIPYSVPWEDDVQLIEVDAIEHKMGERQMGADIMYTATFNGSSPDLETHFQIEARFNGYPQGTFALMDVEDDDVASFAHFDSNESLMGYIKRRQT